MYQAYKYYDAHSMKPIPDLRRRILRIFERAQLHFQDRIPPLASDFAAGVGLIQVLVNVDGCFTSPEARDCVRRLLSQFLDLPFDEADDAPERESCRELIRAIDEADPDAAAAPTWSSPEIIVHRLDELEETLSSERGKQPGGDKTQKSLIALHWQESPSQSIH